MRSRDVAATIAAAVAFSCSIIAGTSVSPAIGAQWLTNGSFDDDLTGWQLGLGTAVDDCGTGIAGIEFDDAASLTQIVSGPFAVGTYRFSGNVRLLQGEKPTVIMTIQDVTSTVKHQLVAPPLGSAYQALSVDYPDLGEVESFRVGVTLSAETDSIVCLDDFAFEGPLGAPAATFTPTSLPTSTSTVVPATATSLPAATSIPAATATAVTPGAATSTATTAATSTPVTPTPASGPSLVFENGGFEDETAAWRKNGGEVEAVSSPRRSGTAAGRFSSKSSATSWLYQAIAIDEAQSYEFGGALMPEGTAGEAYLRISWYASGDGSGSLISSDDSTSRVSNGSSSFTWLTTGPVNPPAGANSARLRVMLVPAGGGEAIVYLDDFTLTTGPLLAPAGSPTPAPAATQTAPAVEATRSAPPASSHEAASTPPPGSTAQITAARATATAKASQTAAVAGPAEGASPAPRRGSNGSSSPLSGSEDVNALPRPGEPAPLWPYFALPGVGLLVLAGLVYGRRKEAI